MTIVQSPSSLHARNRALTRSDPLSHYFQLLEELTDGAKPSQVGRSSLVSASSPRHKLQFCCSAAGHVYGLYEFTRRERLAST